MSDAGGDVVSAWVRDLAVRVAGGVEDVGCTGSAARRHLLHGVPGAR